MDSVLGAATACRASSRLVCSGAGCVARLSVARPGSPGGHWNPAIEHKEQALNSPGQCESIEQVRAHIDRIDRQLVSLLAERGGYVAQAAHFKQSPDEVAAPQRVEQVIAKVKALSGELGANPAVTERVYRAMIGAFIEAELRAFAELAR
ncbi:chorismate mutase [Pseudomonas sp. CrR25]|nr:chorismate mutase [Pseudomonas sp. CrR25]